MLYCFYSSWFMASNKRWDGQYLFDTDFTFFLIFGLINSKILSPFNKAWIKFGEILGSIIAPIIMALVFFVFLTPISFLVRVFGKDLLGIKFNKKKTSYWINRNKKLGSMTKQF